MDLFRKPGVKWEALRAKKQDGSSDSSQKCGSQKGSCLAVSSSSELGIYAVSCQRLSRLRLELHVMVPDVSELQCRQWHVLVFPILPL